MNENLNNAKVGKNDEFYTSYIDIEKELNIYLKYDKDFFYNKKILLPCNDYDSNFYKYFKENYNLLKYKEVIAIKYNPNSNISQMKTFNGVECDVNIPTDGSFKSVFVSNMKYECDLIFTNPPFSLFRDFIDWISDFKGDYSIWVI